MKGIWTIERVDKTKLLHIGNVIVKQDKKEITHIKNLWFEFGVDQKYPILHLEIYTRGMKIEGIQNTNVKIKELKMRKNLRSLWWSIQRLFKGKE